MQALRTGLKIEKGSKVLINGASGGVGTFAIQLAKSMGAHVTGVCSTGNVEMVRALGADAVVDYTRESIEDYASSEGISFDKIIDAAGRPGWRPLLTPMGEVVHVALPYPESEWVICVLLSILFSPWCCCCLSSKKSHALLQVSLDI